ncbi:hypothetical protein NQ315_007741 [Exocentrus adspersus]|uniref:Nucleoporin p58/p45 n=1 Tax=Exocentrus adspersus TaxID=1586481 RepID=A0AAV8WA93_9CUCU|nr:hypothetical protein NQ315_007741 [Exocentrus adspersus]
MSTGFGFGVAKTTALPAFGTGSITFGTPATTTLQNPPGFGFTATPAVPAPVTGFQFGAPTTSTSTPSLFGSTASTLKPTGFGTSSQAGGLFGTTVSAAAPAAPAPGLSFGVPSAATAVLNLGAPSTAASAPTGLFGTAAVPAAPAASFGAPTTAAPALFGATTTSNVSTGLFGAPTTTTATLGFGFGVSSAAPTLGKPTTTSTTGGLTFGIGAPTSSSALTFGLGVATSTASTNPNVVSAPSVVGLGGQASSQMKTGAAVTTQKEVAPKEQPLPNEILQTVEHSDIARCSIRDFKKVEQEIDLLNSVLNEVECQLQKNRYLAEKLKYDTAKSLQNVEMAQRTQDTPPGLQYENSAPLKFFLDLADHFEREMQALKMHIEAADRYVKNNRNPDMLTPQDLSVGIRRLHETFVALAGRLQSVHNQVESQKDIYLNIRRHFYNDPSNPFEKISKTTEFNVTNINNALIYSPPKVATGPTPFNQMMSFSGNPLMQQQNPPAYPGTSTSTAPAPSGFGNALSFQVGTQPSNTSLFGQSTFGNTSTNFQLQKPPTGYKRGKQ